MEVKDTSPAGSGSIVAMATSLWRPLMPPITALDIAFLPGTITLELPLGIKGAGSTKWYAIFSPDGADRCDLGQVTVASCSDEGFLDGAPLLPPISPAVVSGSPSPPDES